MAFVFPGQGAQYPGMGKELATRYRGSRSVFEQVDHELGFPLSELCFNGPEADLKLTENTQPAILTMSIAAWQALTDEGVQPDFVAGHSLGEYSALVASGALPLVEAVQLVRGRGRYMQEAVPVGQGAMAAILGMPPERVDAVCREAAQGMVVSPANLNTLEQTVIAGHIEAVQRAGALAKVRGAKRVLTLPVSAPFHCALMQPARERLALDLEAAVFADLSVPLITNVDADVIMTAEQARDALCRQVTSPVRWLESVQRMAELGVSTFVEVGPGKALTGMIRRILPEAIVFNVEDEKSLMAFMAICHV